ncbi:MAG: M50 family metallopeptidase [Anaerolineales bacterium]|nr:M50 family metallopeptidase [Anaerolineales bacterium]
MTTERDRYAERMMNPPAPLDRKRVLTIAFIAFVVVFFLWQTRSIILYPFYLLVTYVHEMGHGLAAVFTGGRFVSFHVYPNGAGVAYTDGGNQHLILVAGYVGTALFGAMLLYLANRVRRVTLVSYGMAAFSSSLRSFWRFGRLEYDHRNHRLFAIMIGVTAGVGFIALARYGNRTANVLILNTFAFIIGFNVINDFLYLFNNQTIGIDDIPNDAAAMAKLTSTPTASWIILWLMISILMMGIAAIYAL